MSKGFLIFSQNANGHDYLKQAYALALSIKVSQPINNAVALMTNDKVPDEYLHAFDYVVEIPWEHTEEDRLFFSDSRWKIFHVTPFDETIVLDSDMLLFKDITMWWDHLSNFDLKFCSRINNFRGIPVVDTFHRKTFIENDLPNVYFALHYFKKSDLALEFYKTLEFVIKNWEWHYTKFAPKNYQSWVSMDLSAAIAVEIMGLQEQVVSSMCPLEFVHMKTPLQDWKPQPNKWTDAVHYSLNSNKEFIVSNIKQSNLFHYIQKDFVTDAMINTLKGHVDV